jgi:PAS domain-containing protein
VVTERKEREIKLAHQENVLNALFRSLMIGIALFDYLEGKYLDVNDSALGMLGYSRDEFEHLGSMMFFLKNIMRKYLLPWNSFLKSIFAARIKGGVCQ